MVLYFTTTFRLAHLIFCSGHLVTFSKTEFYQLMIPVSSSYCCEWMRYYTSFSPCLKVITYIYTEVSYFASYSFGAISSIYSFGLFLLWCCLFSKVWWFYTIWSYFLLRFNLNSAFLQPKEEFYFASEAAFHCICFLLRFIQVCFFLLTQFYLFVIL